MRTVLIYDIDNDRVRGKVADACLDYGMRRIQYSSFFGELTPNHLEELLMRIRKLVERCQASIEAFPVCEKDMRLRRTLTAARLQPARRPGRPPVRLTAEDAGDAEEAVGQALEEGAS